MHKQSCPFICLIRAPSNVQAWKMFMLLYQYKAEVHQKPSSASLRCINSSVEILLDVADQHFFTVPPEEECWIQFCVDGCILDNAVPDKVQSYKKDNQVRCLN